MENKEKGQVGRVSNIVVVTLVVAVFLVAGFFVTQEFLSLNSFYDEKSVDNENGAIDSTGYQLTAEDGQKTDSFEVTNAENASNGNDISDTEYNVDSTDGVVTNATSTTYDNVDFNYTYSEGQSGWTGVNQTMDAMLTIPSILGLVLVVLLLSVVLAIVFNIIPRETGGTTA